MVALPAGEILQWVASWGNRLIDSKPWVSIFGVNIIVSNIEEDYIGFRV